MAAGYGVGATGFEVFGGGPNITTDPAVTTAASGSTFLAWDGQYLDYEHDDADSNVSDSKSNAYVWAHPKLAYANYPGASARASICWAGTGGSGHTWTAQMPDGYEGTLLVVELTGVTRVQDHQTTHRAASTSIVSPTATASQQAVAVATIWGYSSDTSLTVSDGFEIVAHYPADVTSLHGAMAVKVIPAGGAVSCTWTISDSQEAEVSMTIFEGESGQTGGTLSYTATGGAVAGGAAAAAGHVVGVQYEAIGAQAVSAANGTTVAPSYAALGTINPATDGIALIVGQKPSTANGGTVTTPSGFTLVQEHLAQGGYGSTLGADTGNTNLRVYTKDTVTGSESGTLTVTVGTNSVSWARFVRYSKQGTGAIQIAAATASDTAAGDVSLTFGSDPGVQTGDLMLIAMCIPTDVNGTASFSSPAISQTGVTFGAISEIADSSSGNGNDIGCGIWQVHANSGTSSAAPTFTATGGTTKTNLRGPAIALRIREASATSYSHTGAGGGIAGGAASEARTVLQAVAGGAIAGGVAAAKRGLVALVAGGAIAGGAAQISTGSANASAYTTTGGAIAGGTAGVTLVAKAAGAGGAVAGGAATEKRAAARATAGGAVVGGAATVTQVAKAKSSGGGVVGGAAHEARAVVARASGGAVAGGAAQTVQPPRYTMQGGAVGGGSAYEKRSIGIQVSGGAVGGGAATERRTVAVRPSTGAVGGGAATIRRANALTAQGGAVAGGAATEKRSIAYVASGGGVVGGASSRLQTVIVVGAGGGVAGGYATWSSSAPIEYYYGAEGGGVAGGAAAVVQTANRSSLGGAVAGGSVRSHIVGARVTTGGAVAGGAALERRAVNWVGVGGSVAGGNAHVSLYATVLPLGGAIAGGAARVQIVQSGTFAYYAVGGAIAGGVATVAIVLAPVAPVAVVGRVIVRERSLRRVRVRSR